MPPNEEPRPPLSIQQREFRRLMEQIRHAHEAFKTSWVEVRTAALKIRSLTPKTASWERIWEANGIAYAAAQPLADRRDRLLKELFEEHLVPLHERLLNGDPDAVNAVIDFLEVDVSAFRCGFAKQDYLRRLKSVPLSAEHLERLSQYGLRLCGIPTHRREIGQAGRLMIRVANRDFVDHLEALTTSENRRVREKSAKMLTVVRNGREDLR